MHVLIPADLREVIPLSRVEALGATVGSAVEVELVLWTVVLGALILDVGLTVYGLSLGLAEKNPVMRHALDSVGIVALPVAKAIAVALAVGFRMAWPEYAIVAPLGLAVPWALAVAHNAALLASL